MWFFQLSCMDVRVGLQSWVLKNWCFWTVVSEKTLENLLDWKVIKPINLKGNVLNIIGRTDTEDEAPIFGHMMQRTDSLENILILGKIEGRRKRGWQRMRWLDGITDWTDCFEQAAGVGDGQESLACCIPWGHKNPRQGWVSELNCNDLELFLHISGFN